MPIDSFDDAIRQINRDQAIARRQERERQEMKRNLRIIGRRLVWAGVIIAGVVLYNKHKQQDDTQDEE